MRNLSSIVYFSTKRSLTQTNSNTNRKGSQLLTCQTSLRLANGYASTQTHLQQTSRRRWVWITAPLGIGAALASYLCIRQFTRKDDGSVKIAKGYQVSLYRALPLRSMSRAWGKFNDLSLPTWSRKPLLSIYIRMFGCNVQEAAVEDLQHYKNLGEFFRRSLKPGVRPVDASHSLVMPSDGKVLNFGEVNNGVIEQVKGVTYSLKGFLGPNNQWLYQNNNNNGPLSDLEWEKKLNESDTELRLMSDTQHYRSILHNKENALHHIVIYLAPGDYHRFHSPADWTVEHRRHFPGDLLSVNPKIASWVQGLFNMNERAVYTGTWKHGFFSMAAVGATNVGSIRTYFDKNLETNIRNSADQARTYNDLSFDGGVDLRKGELFGEFNLGSTIVLVFEAPKTFNFTEMSLNKVVRVGEALGDKSKATINRSAAAQA